MRTNLPFSICLATVMLAACNSSAPPAEGGESTGSSTTETSTETEGETETGDTEAGTDSDTDEPQACWTDLAFGEHEVIYQGFTGGSEGIAFGETDGMLYVSSNHRVWRV